MRSAIVNRTPDHRTVRVEALEPGMRIVDDVRESPDGLTVKEVRHHERESHWVEAHCTQGPIIDCGRGSGATWLPVDNSRPGASNARA